MTQRLRPALVLASLLFSIALSAQTTFPYNGVYDQADRYYALTGATVHVNPERTVDNATLVIRDGRVESVTAGGQVPRGAVEVNAEGKHIYPSFVEVYGNYGMPETERNRRSRSDGPQMESETDGAYSWNQALRPETDAAALFTIDAKAAKALREAGFGTVSTHHHDGISRGSAAVVTLAESSDNEVLLARDVAHHLSFDKGSSGQDYPNSRMGAMALLRQTYLDADWYGAGDRAETNLSIEAWRKLQDMPQIFEVEDWQNALRADKVGDEFGVQYVIRGGGDEYQRPEALKASGATFILPLTFPDAYDVTDPFAADMVSLAQLRHWERAPGNMAAVAEAGIPFVITADGLEKPTDLHEAMRKAIKAGADERTVMAALTTGPAELLGIADRVGALEQGMLANFIVTDKNPFTEKATIYQNWVQGYPFELKPLEATDLADAYDITVGDERFVGEVSGDPGSRKMKLTTEGDSSKTDVTFSESGDVLTLRFKPEGESGYYRITATPDGEGYSGTGRDAGGRIVNFRATPRAAAAGSSAASEEEDEETEEDKDYVSRLTYPNIAYGLPSMPEAETVLFRNATVWTNEEEGILEEADVLIQGGKIAGVGQGLSDRGATVIDATGMHLTSGVIDEHSHIALSSVNEGTQSSTAEVRMADVVDAVDENIYRQLAGGVTVSQLLHGSANPIGGQSALVKLRWGATPDEMLFEGADPFIKFALGENVKQSNWGDANRVRYPQTRMGVEQIFENYFSRAREYGRAIDAGEDVRRDLELEALLQILNDERFITCHSYQQGEINMLMELAERHDFRVNTFTHILEGYKVADKMAEHGAAGSTFSDWWAYKYEVNEAIPYNGALMYEQDVVTAFNSDDAEMARRLNQEAGKAVLFGGVPEEEAWKFVTLNPAKMLHIDDRVGSIKVGKDADLVLWNDHPMSIYARAERTFVDGREFFNREENETRREALMAERNDLIQASLDAKNAGGKTQPPRGNSRRLLHCDSLNH
ncbi:imidazolonepropionase-like amidohydrolase [Neolewinella xylanilytica]|uniref:Imidazolonepropionase-like amidohydrolase n=1 Tax=Neolewinella xylanilytica TaxID=1514080 RepID=A0A2S6I0Z5_9BACT|nr:amidohydrolase family protein [Neolewinella xylanilytica]PPK84632.1 imidazolonepropionase-like amidohydrolase [Neolewinella xylanilytica]